MPRTAGPLLMLRDALFGVAVIAVLWLTAAAPGAAARWAQVGLAGVALIAVVLRRTQPALAVAASLLATCAAWTLGLTHDPFVLTAWCVLALAERRGKRAVPWWMIVTGASLFVVTLGVGAEGLESRIRGGLLGAVVLSAGWVLGVRTREAQTLAAARSRTEERLRLARDVHDVLSHSLGAIGVRAGVTAHVTSLGESELRDALREIEQDARESLAELKLLLHRERVSDHDQTGSADDPAPGRKAGDAAGESSSAPLSEILAGLARTARHAGVHTMVDAPDDVDALPLDVRTTLHRVAQEAVTNVIRHASASRASIVVAVLAQRVQLDVRDDGVGAGGGMGPEGHGLTGLRERVALMGGTVHIDAAEPGFGVTVSLPLSLADAHGRSGA